MITPGLTNYVVHKIWVMSKRGMLACGHACPRTRLPEWVTNYTMHELCASQTMNLTYVSLRPYLSANSPVWVSHEPIESKTIHMGLVCPRTRLHEWVTNCMSHAVYAVWNMWITNYLSYSHNYMRHVSLRPCLSANSPAWVSHELYESRNKWVTNYASDATKHCKTLNYTLLFYMSNEICESRTIWVTK